MSPLRRTPARDAETLGDTPRPDDGPGRALDTLLAELVDDDPELRRRAVRDLADRDEARAALVDRVGTEPDRSVRDALCAQLSRHDRPDVVDGLLRHLASDDAGLRTAVVEVLGALPTATAARIPQLLADPDPDVRILTVMVLARLRLAAVEGWLTGLVRGDDSPNVVSAAIGELALLAGARCVADLEGARERFPTDPFIGFTVSQALATMDGE